MKYKLIVAGILNISLLIVSFALGVKIFFAIGIMVLCSLAFFLILSNISNNNDEKDKFYELTTYMEQMLCSYKRWGKISTALEDCVSIFEPKSRMGKILFKAFSRMTTGATSDSDITREGLKVIEKEYKSRRLFLLHEFLVEAEKVGGELIKPLDILLNDLELWKRRTRNYQKKREWLIKESLFAAALAICLCVLSRCIMPSFFNENQVEGMVYQISTSLFVVSVIVVECLVIKRLSRYGLIDKKDYNRTLSKEYAIVSRKKSGFRYERAKRICKREVEKEFPYWLLSVTLYLQQESLYQALIDSRQICEGFFLQEINILLEKIYEKPSSLKPFLEMFEKLDLQEVRTGMTLLYSISSNGLDNMDRQIHFLVEQNTLMMDKCENNRFEINAARTEILKQAPFILAGVKVVTDMAVVLLLSFGQYQSFL